jgi:hypothetical protein
MWRRLLTAVTLACSLSLLIAATVPTSGFHPMMAALAVAAVLAAVSSRALASAPKVASALFVSTSSAAQRRRRGALLRQSNPDTAGRARPRAPGHA